MLFVNVSGILTSACAFLAKHPPVQFDDKIAKEMLEQFIAGKRITKHQDGMSIKI